MSEKRIEEPKITSIEQQKKNRSRYNIYINGEYSFAVHEDILVKYRLIKGREMDPEEMKEVLEAEERNKAMQYGLRYLSFRPRTITEVRDYLIKKGFMKEDVEQVIDSFIEKKYLDDQTYAKQWVEERKRLKPRGRYLMKAELTQRGVGDDEANLAIEQLSSQEEKEMIERWIEKKITGKKFDNLYDLKRKLVPFLQRKGFPLDTIQEVVHRVGPDYVKSED